MSKLEERKQKERENQTKKKNDIAMLKEMRRQKGELHVQRRMIQSKEMRRQKGELHVQRRMIQSKNNNKNKQTNVENQCIL